MARSNALFDRIVEFNILNKRRALVQFTERILNETEQIFEYENLPESIPKRILENFLQMNGNVFWYKHNDTLYVFTGGLGGEPDVYYEPTIYTVANPALAISKNLKIDVDGILMRNDSLQQGLLPIINKYGTLLTEADISFRSAIINTRATNLISAGDDKTLASAKEYIRQLENGNTAIIGESQLLDGVRVQPLMNKDNLNELRETYQYIKAQLFAEIGLKTAHNMKREYVSAEETAINDDTLIPFIDNMLECRQIALEKVNTMFGTNIKVSLKGTWKLQAEELEQALEVAEMSVEEKEMLGNEESEGISTTEPNQDEQLESDDSGESTADGATTEEGEVTTENTDETEEETKIENNIEVIIAEGDVDVETETSDTDDTGAIQPNSESDMDDEV